MLFLKKENQIFQNLDYKFGILFALDMNEINKKSIFHISITIF